MNINKPQPQRFETYQLLPDGKSFTISNCKFVFKLDRYGGWKDQYGNYYNSSGDPDFEPEDGELTPEELSSQEDYHGDDYDELYGGLQHDDDEESNQEGTHILHKISKNMETLSTYPNNKNLRVFFSNMPYKVPPKEVYERFSKKVEGILNIVFTLKDNKRNGEGHFVMEDLNAAQKLIKLEDEKVESRQVHFEVEKLEQLIMDPIKQSELKPFWKTSNIPKFYNSAMKKQEVVQQKQQKVVAQPKPEKTEKKQEEKKQKIKQEIKVVPEFLNYHLNFEIFETKTRFVNWMKEQKAQRDVDYKNINKRVQGNKDVITMDVRTKIVEACKGKKYEGKEVIFTPTQN